jgi:putative phosphoesterase
MKIALISDVHANLIALEAVLADMEGREVVQILSAGDVIGYYPYPRETIALFQERSIISIQGNHDRAVLSAGDPRMNPWARNALSWTVAQLDEAEMDYLRRLPRHLSMGIEGTRVAMYHGAPFDDDHYLYEEEAAEDLLEMARCDLLVLGHTHEPFIKRFKRGMIVNPGSVGQPRDGDPDASYSIYDTSTRKAFLLRVPYDIQTVADRTREKGLPSSLADRLFSGY